MKNMFSRNNIIIYNYGYNSMIKLIKKIITKLILIINNYISRFRDRKVEKRCQSNNFETIKGIIKITDLDYSSIDKNIISYHLEMYLSHRFDLLGSGWINNSYSSKSLGLEEYKYDMNLDISSFDDKGEWLNKVILPSHLNLSRKIWKLINKNYIPIDWGKDSKSGYRWSAKTWYKDCRNRLPIGVDLKVPWELSRMQHLLQISIFAVTSDKNIQTNIIREFHDQILDFISTNPPAMGVNWTCTMDVGIRITNMILAYDILKQLDTDNILNDDFQTYFSRSIYDHGRHIIENLEYSEELSSNHYLANIVGILFISVYLKDKYEMENWLVFGIQELIREFDKQFYDDGSNFEGSTNYHRLSGELIVYSVALIQGLSEEKIKTISNYDHTKWKYQPKLLRPSDQKWNLDSRQYFPDWFMNRLYKAGLFTMDLTKIDGTVPQIGDNDSGRLFKITPIGKFITNELAEKKYTNLNGYNELIKGNVLDSKKDRYWDENILNHMGFISSLFALYNTNDKYFNAFLLEKSLIDTLSRKKYLTFNKEEINFKGSKHRISYDENKLPYEQEKIIKPKLQKDINLLENLCSSFYYNSGIYLFKSDRLYLCLNAGPNGQNDNGGHAHNDKLSIELSIDNENIFLDPGTYLYTPIPIRRNLFRSINAHNTIHIKDAEHNRWKEGRLGLFHMYNDAKCDLLSITETSIKILLRFREYICLRSVKINENCIVIKDLASHPIIAKTNNFGYFSNGYGKLIKM